MKIVTANCFCTDQESSGNPAAIVFDAKLDDNEKQLLARKLNYPVTVFVETGEIPHIRFFYPEVEMEMCIHGSLAAAYILMREKKAKTLLLNTRKKSLKFIKHEDNLIQVEVFSDSIPVVNINKKLALTMLNLNDENNISSDLPFCIASVGSPKLLIPLTISLSGLQPNIDFIKQWSIENKINGIYVYSHSTHNNQVNFHARAFNPKTGYKEDAATGVAAGALALVMKKNIIIEQGYSMHKPCQIAVTYQSDGEIYVGGIVKIINEKIDV